MFKTDYILNQWLHANSPETTDYPFLGQNSWEEFLKHRSICFEWHELLSVTLATLISSCSFSLWSGNHGCGCFIRIPTTNRTLSQYPVRFVGDNDCVDASFFPFLLFLYYDRWRALFWKRRTPRVIKANVMRYNAESRVTTNTTDASIIVQTELCARDRLRTLVCTDTELNPWNSSDEPAYPIISPNTGVTSCGPFAGITGNASGKENRRVKIVTRSTFHSRRDSLIRKLDEDFRFHTGTVELSNQLISAFLFLFFFGDSVFIEI